MIEWNQVKRVCACLVGWERYLGIGNWVRRELYEGILVLTLTVLYGTETNMGVAEKEQLNVTEIKCLRNMCGRRWRGEIRDEEVGTLMF